MTIKSTSLIKYYTGQGKTRDLLKQTGHECIKTLGGPPNLFVVILPEGGNDIYTEVKQLVASFFLFCQIVEHILMSSFGDIEVNPSSFLLDGKSANSSLKMGIPTQCMKSIKCSRAKSQYYANISLK